MPGPIIQIKVDVTDRDMGYKKLVREFTKDVSHVDVGIHPTSGEKLVMIASTHEFGATIQHPGGQPFLIVKARSHSAGESRDQRSRYLPLPDGKEMIFLKKGSKGMGVTKAHTIHIPARSFIRSTVDEQRTKYEHQAGREWDAILDQRSTIQQALVAMGFLIETDIRMKILTLKKPGLQEETIRRKGSDNPLIDTGEMLNSIRWVVKNKQDKTIQEGPTHGG